MDEYFEIRETYYSITNSSVNLETDLKFFGYQRVIDKLWNIWLLSTETKTCLKVGLLLVLQIIWNNFLLSFSLYGDWNLKSLNLFRSYLCVEILKLNCCGLFLSICWFFFLFLSRYRAIRFTLNNWQQRNWLHYPITTRSHYLLKFLNFIGEFS